MYSQAGQLSFSDSEQQQSQNRNSRNQQNSVQSNQSFENGNEKFRKILQIQNGKGIQQQNILKKRPSSNYRSFSIRNYWNELNEQNNQQDQTDDFIDDVDLDGIIKKLKKKDSEKQNLIKKKEISQQSQPKKISQNFIQKQQSNSIEKVNSVLKTYEVNQSFFQKLKNKKPNSSNYNVRTSINSNSSNKPPLQQQTVKKENNQIKDVADELENLKKLMNAERKKINEVLNKGNQILNSSQNNTQQSFFNKNSLEKNQMQNSHFQENQSKFKEGILGSINEYNKMEKSELIDKLIVVENLMKKLYLQNQQLKKQIKGSENIQENFNQQFQIQDQSIKNFQNVIY